MLCLVLLLALLLVFDSGQAQLGRMPLIRPAGFGHFRLGAPGAGSRSHDQADAAGCIKGSSRHGHGVPAGDKEGCMAECRQSAICQYFAFSSAYGCLHAIHRPESNLLTRHADLLFCPSWYSTTSQPSNATTTVEERGRSKVSNDLEEEGPCLQEGVVWRGTTLQFVYVDPLNALQDCRAFCANKPGCQYFVTDGLRGCYLQSSKHGGHYDNPGWTSATPHCGHFLTTTRHPSSAFSLSTPHHSLPDSPSTVNDAERLPSRFDSTHMQEDLDKVKRTRSMVDTTRRDEDEDEVLEGSEAEVAVPFFMSRSEELPVDRGEEEEEEEEEEKATTGEPPVVEGMGRKFEDTQRGEEEGGDDPQEGEDFKVVDYDITHFSTSTQHSSTSPSPSLHSTPSAQQAHPNWRPLRQRRRPPCEFVNAKWVGPTFRHIRLEGRDANALGCQEACEHRDACRFFMLHKDASCYLLAHQIGIFRTPPGDGWVAATVGCELKEVLKSVAEGEEETEGEGQREGRKSSSTTSTVSSFVEDDGVSPSFHASTEEKETTAAEKEAQEEEGWTLSSSAASSPPFEEVPASFMTFNNDDVDFSSSPPPSSSSSSKEFVPALGEDVVVETEGGEGKEGVEAGPQVAFE